MTRYLRPSNVGVHGRQGVTVSRQIADDGLLSTAEVAKRLKMHRSTIWLYIKRGMLKSTRRGVFHGVTETDLRAFLGSYPVDQIQSPKRKKRKPKK